MSVEALRDLPRPLAFVLPGGGALGAYQVGVLRALAEHDITADMLVGVSAGSLNAAYVAWSPGVVGLVALERVWRSVRRRDLLRVNPGRLALAFTGRRASFLDSRHGAQWIRRILGQRRIEDAPTRLAVVATDVTTGRAVALTHGDLVSAVLGSAAFPGVYPPVWRDGRWLMDGGVVADVPLDLAAELGAASAVVLSVPALAEGPPRMRAIDLLFRASTFGVEAHGRTMLARPPSGLATVEVPARPSPVTTFAVSDAPRMIGDGHATATAWLTGTGAARD